jgi:NADH:ubiquinone oxidoreductase subunit 6 (subunit J)
MAELFPVMRTGTREGFAVVVVSPAQVGMSLLGPYMLGVELASMLLLAGLVGAYHLAVRIGPERKGGRLI